MQIKKLLFHTHFREFSFQAMETLLELKNVGLTEIILLYVIDREKVSFVPFGGYLKDEEDRIREAARINFEKWRQSLADHEIESQALVLTGTPNMLILKTAQEKGVDLIVTGRKKRTMVEKVYVGSHILDLLRRSPIPILMHKYQAEYATKEGTYTRNNRNIFKIPMIATDWSEPSKNALMAMKAFKMLADKVQVAHVIDSRMVRHPSGEAFGLLENESRERLEKYCSRLTKMGFSSEFFLSIGKVTPEIIRLSREYGATMIVLGRTGKDWFEEYWLGGVSHRVAELSELPVLLVP